VGLLHGGSTKPSRCICTGGHMTPVVAIVGENPSSQAARFCVWCVQLSSQVLSRVGTYVSRYLHPRYLPRYLPI
jgi:hypothetical protein